MISTVIGGAMLPFLFEVRFCFQRQTHLAYVLDDRLVLGIRHGEELRRMLIGAAHSIASMAPASTQWQARGRVVVSQSMDLINTRARANHASAIRRPAMKARDVGVVRGL
jgi:hypothetical protein